MFYQDLLNQREALATGEGPQQDDMSYLGYSVATGEFSGDGEEDLAVGMPRGNNLTGQVVVFDHRLNILYNITGHQVSLAVRADSTDAKENLLCYYFFPSVFFICFDV